MKSSWSQSRYPTTKMWTIRSQSFNKNSGDLRLVLTGKDGVGELEIRKAFSKIVRNVLN